LDESFEQMELETGVLERGNASTWLQANRSRKARCKDQKETRSRSG
jgi:hypothetical protein